MSVISRQWKVSHVDTVDRDFLTNDPHDKGSARFPRTEPGERRVREKEDGEREFLFSCHPLKRREDGASDRERPRVAANKSRASA